MAFYQAHVADLCRKAGIQLSSSGCPLVAEPGLPCLNPQPLRCGPPPRAGCDAFDRAVVAAAAGVVAQGQAPPPPPRECAMGDKGLQPRARAAVENGVWSLYTAFSAALIFKGASHHGELVCVCCVCERERERARGWVGVRCLIFVFRRQAVLVCVSVAFLLACVCLLLMFVRHSPLLAQTC